MLRNVFIGTVIVVVLALIGFGVASRITRQQPPSPVEPAAQEISVKMTPVNGATVQEISKDVPITLEFSAKIKPKEVEILVEREGVEVKGTKASGLTENEIVWTPKKKLEDGDYTVTVTGKKFDSPLVGTTFSFVVKAKAEPPIEPPIVEPKKPEPGEITEAQLKNRTLIDVNLERSKGRQIK